ncbi:hypothetical protein LRD69_26895 [Streptomyces sp. JH14]|uniref:hypothetical protein n=1 Tax=Streptomyces sp. JH14 TaxID=2793630 RepID=UPI0023F705AD|nr:hypothetical protein [Streptomyces sp. JH14]MDF6045707.1 hypothetical protein [Streptomyces sp. JH14]
MSAMRRRLGAGTAIPSPSLAREEQPRLPAAERIDLGALLEARGGEQLVRVRKGRRMLGTGTAIPD